MSKAFWMETIEQMGTENSKAMGTRRSIEMGTANSQKTERKLKEKDTVDKISTGFGAVRLEAGPHVDVLKSAMKNIA